MMTSDIQALILQYDYLYHVTSIANVNSIRSHGLDPSYAINTHGCAERYYDIEKELGGYALFYTIRTTLYNVLQMKYMNNMKILMVNRVLTKH